MEGEWMSEIGCWSSYLLNLGGEGIEIDEQIDPCVRESRHAALVVGSGIDVIHTNSICAQLGHANDIALALGGIDERVVGGELISNACNG